MLKTVLNKFREEAGQTLLIIVLVMVIALTVGLSIASKTIVSLRTSTEEASSQRALSAAEAGIQQTLKTNTPISNSNIASNNSSYSTTVGQVSGTKILLNGGNPILKDDGIDLWLSDYSTNPANIYLNPWAGNTLTLYWGDASGDGCKNAALEVAIIIGPKTAPVLTRYALDPCQARATANHFTYVAFGGGTISGKTFGYRASVAVAAGQGLIARIIPLYFNASVGADGGANAFPSQGVVVTSTGISGGSSSTPTKRKITVFQGYPELPSEYFPYNLLSP